MTHCYATFRTPAGDFSLAVDETNAVVASAFGDVSALRRRFTTTDLVREAGCTAEAREQVAAYFAGARREFSLRLAPGGTPFQQRVWAALQRIPFGATCSYGELAARLGNPQASRAVGRANATNPLCLFIPCHRVVGADGALTGFAFGEEIKRLLLEHEGALVRAQDLELSRTHAIEGGTR